MRGHLTMICGPMFAGKTTYLLDNYAKEGGVLLKPSFDTRYSESEVVSHDNVRYNAYPISSISDIANIESSSTYFVDEAQFLYGERYSGDFVADVMLMLDHGANFYICGLDMDWQGKPFPVCANLLALADRVIKLKAYCGECGGEASKTYMKNITEKTVALGSDDLYDARCNVHWFGESR